jgi:hypothetical protein
MKILLFIFCIAFCGAASAQCNFPTEVEGNLVTGVYAYQGKVYLSIKGEGFKELTDTSGKYQVLGYVKEGEQGYASLACGERVPVKMEMPLNFQSIQTPLTPMQSAGRNIKQGATLTIIGFVAGGLLTGSSLLIDNSTVKKAVLISGLAITVALPLAGLSKIAVGGGQLERIKL